MTEPKLKHTLKELLKDVSAWELEPYLEEMIKELQQLTKTKPSFKNIFEKGIVTINNEVYVRIDLVIGKVEKK